MNIICFERSQKLKKSKTQPKPQQTQKHELKFRELPAVKDTKLMEEHFVTRIQAEIGRRSSNFGFWDNAESIQREDFGTQMDRTEKKLTNSSPNLSAC